MIIYNFIIPYKVYSNDTFQIFVQLWMTHFENESATEALRQRLNRKSSFDLQHIFDSIDFDQDKYLNEIDVCILNIINKIYIVFILACKAL